MLGKLFGYDFKAIGRPACLIHLIVLGVTLLAMIAGFAGYWMSELDPTSMTEALQAVAALGVVSGFVALACLVPATFIVVIQRFYANFYTDQGYLTFTLPTRASTLLWSKILAGSLWLLISIVVATQGALVLTVSMNGLVEGYDFYDSVPYWILNVESLGIGGAGEVPTVIFGSLSSIASLASLLLLAYAALTLGATWARQHKVACGIALFIGIGWVANMITGTIDIALSLNSMFGYDSSSYFDGFRTTAIYLTHITKDVALAIGCFCVTLYCMKHHVNLN